MVEPPVDTQLDALATYLIRWEDFDRLLLRLGRDVPGLGSRSFSRTEVMPRSVGCGGVNGDGRMKGVQAKRHQGFSAAGLDAAVNRRTQSALPFDLVRFVLWSLQGLSARANRLLTCERNIGIMTVDCSCTQTRELGPR